MAYGQQMTTISAGLWSVIAIARNEQATIAACLQSARTALGDRLHELILVDSASTDATVQNASALPGVQVVNLPVHPLLGPSLGRYAGQQVAKGEWLLFLDGDMVLLPGWLEVAIKAFAQDAQLVGLAGEMEHCLPDGSIVLHRYPESNYHDADYLGGAALYRRSAAVTVGGFNPYFHSYEEEEFGARLRQAGFTLRRLRTPMTRHHPKFEGQSLRELLRRRSRSFYVGAGQLARSAMSHKLPIKRPIKPISRYLGMMLMLAAGVVSSIAGLLGAGWWWWLAWVGLMLSVFGLFVLKAHGVSRPAYYFTEWIVAGPDVIRGFLQRPRETKEFSAQWARLRQSGESTTQ